MSAVSDEVKARTRAFRIQLVIAGAFEAIVVGLGVATAIHFNQMMMIVPAVLVGVVPVTFVIIRWIVAARRGDAVSNTAPNTDIVQ